MCAYNYMYKYILLNQLVIRLSQLIYYFKKDIFLAPTQKWILIIRKLLKISFLLHILKVSSYLQKVPILIYIIQQQLYKRALLFKINLVYFILIILSERYHGQNFRYYNGLSLKGTLERSYFIFKCFIMCFVIWSFFLSFMLCYVFHVHLRNDHMHIILNNNTVQGLSKTYC